MKRLATYLFLGTGLLFGCSSDDQQDGGATGDIAFDEPVVEEETQTIGLVPINNSVEFPGATLGMQIQASNDDSTRFTFDVSGYELGAQTEGPHTALLANSGKGQHVHLIVNNAPYSAHYTPSATKLLDAGHHTVLAFLSRSYHESVKNEESFAVSTFSVGDVEGEHPVDLTKAHMFYSRPKGTYSAKDGENLLLDFFLVNCDLAENGYTVKATINDQAFTIDTWVPHVITGLNPGEVNVTLELVDDQGNTVDSPFNPVSRTVTIANE